MSSSSVYLFQGNSLVFPESLKDEEAAGGTDKEAAERAFGKLEYSSVPPIGSILPPAECYLLKNDVTLPQHWRSLMVRQLLTVMAGSSTGKGYDSISTEASGGIIGRLLRCYHVIQWRNESVYCGSCGERNGDSAVELARLCPRCGRIEYPRISPAVIVLIVDDSDRILLAHNNNFKNNMYSLIAGFVEAGESLEGAVTREIKEELDIDVHNICYVRSQSWPFPNSLMVGFTARYKSGVLRPDGNEIADARWFSRETINQSIAGKAAQNSEAGENSFVPDLPGRGSISRYIIDKWVEEKSF